MLSHALSQASSGQMSRMNSAEPEQAPTHRQKIKNAAFEKVLERLKEIEDPALVATPEFAAELRAHFEHLPTRFVAAP